MAVQNEQQILVVILVSILLAAKTSSQPKPGCPGKCGALNIPYPFGTREGCYLDAPFYINCTRTSNSTTPTPFLGPQGNVTVLNISLEDGEMRISTTLASYCYNETLIRRLPWLRLAPFHVSSRRNKFAVVGCDTLGLIKSLDLPRKNHTTGCGCASLCKGPGDSFFLNGSCSGAGCCLISIPEGLSNLRFDFFSLNNPSTAQGYACSHAFVVEEKAYSFSVEDVINFPNKTVPLVLDWAVGNQTCKEAQMKLTSYACKANHSKCYNSINGDGYRCKCASGFRGNPYLLDGCQDINECAESNPCSRICLNLIGGFICACPNDYEGDGRIGGSGCRKVSSTSMGDYSQKIWWGLFFGTFVLPFEVCLLRKTLRRRAIKKQKEKFFKKNGGLLLQQRFSSGEVKVDRTKLFSLKDLEKATDHFNVNRVLGKGGQGTVYKGMLVDGRIVAVKKFKVQGKVEEFINEFVILSQINHRNVVKLLGCCLETEVPLLVYEFIPNGNLFQYLHEPNEDSPMTWNMRLRIASEVAGALYYLHSFASQPIYHRDIKSTNILLDEKYRAKVADFGISRMVSTDDTHLTTQIQGTFGYLDPYYFRTSHFTEKSDVYSFGVVLVELLTGQKPISSIGSEEAKSLAQCFIASLEENRLVEIIDNRILIEVEQEHIMAVANLAERCLKLNGKK